MTQADDAIGLGGADMGGAVDQVIGQWLPAQPHDGDGRGRWDLLLGTFGDPIMESIFSERATVAAWLAAERALAWAEAQAGLIKPEEADAIIHAAQPGAIDYDRLWEEARNVGYPILPLVRMVASALPPGPDGRVHYGATTQDIMDTGLALQMTKALDRLNELLGNFGDHLAAFVEREAQTVMAARTHAQHAVPTTFGAKIGVMLAECARHWDRIAQLRPRVSVVSLYGAGGTSASFGGNAAEVRAHMAGALGLHLDDVPWHVARDRVAEFGMMCAALAATAGRFAREVIALSQTEVREVAEIGGHHRGASSTMPQKHNPIGSEVVVGMAGAAASLVSGILTAMSPTHERGAGEWQIEWFVLPSLACLSGGAIYNAANIASGLSVFPDRMRANLTADGGLLMAEAHMMKLAPVLGRERAHDVIYEAAQVCRATGTALSEAVASLLERDGTAQASSPPAGLSPEDYVGDVALTCEKALQCWRRWRVQSRE
jgi:3-carboxy-cis,cis-muconate cycloisomerase